MDTAEFVVAVIAGAAAAASAVIAVVARADAKKSGDAASRAADRVTEATVTMAEIQKSNFDGPPWTIQWFGGKSFLITNTSPVDAVNVDLDTLPEDLKAGIDVDGPYEIGAKSAIKFMYTPMMNDPFSRDVVVTWSRAGETERRTWRHPIPPAE